MLDPTTIDAIDRHGAAHTADLCSCPCYQALFDVARAVNRENQIRRRMARTAPEVLVALLGAEHPDDSTEEPRP